MPIVPINRTPSSDRPLPPARVRTRPAPEVEAPAPTEPERPAFASDSYEVGYKKPPKHTQFKPGRSGNPKGRPKAAKGLNTLARDLLTQKVAVRTPAGEKRMSRMEAVMQKTHELAMKGNARALAELFRLYANAVPDQRQDTPGEREEDLTATDLAMLEELRRMLGGQQEQGQ